MMNEWIFPVTIMLQSSIEIQHNKSFGVRDVRLRMEEQIKVPTFKLNLTFGCGEQKTHYLKYYFTLQHTTEQKLLTISCFLNRAPFNSISFGVCNKEQFKGSKPNSTTCNIQSRYCHERNKHVWLLTSCICGLTTWDIVDGIMAGTTILILIRLPFFHRHGKISIITS